MTLRGGRINGSFLITVLVLAAAATISLIFDQPATPLSAQSAAGVTLSAQGATGAELYATKCATCHQPAGQGVQGTFPPLAGNPAATDAAYVTDVVTNGRTGTVEVDGVSYTTPMPAVAGLSDDEVAAVVAFVVDLAGRTNEPADTTPTTTAAPEPPDVDKGEDLFTGSNRFDNGAAACASCHTAGSVGNLSGWGLGPDLTTVHERLGGDIGLGAWLSNPPSKTMTPLFADKPLTEPEIGHLVAFLGDAPSQDRQSGPDRLILAGLGGAVVLLLGMAVAWRGMRQTYVSRLRSNR